jgi:hypothetical protein
MNRIPPRLAFAAAAILALALLLFRARPLARLSGTIQPLLYASGLTEPRSLLFLPDGTLLVGQGKGNGVVRVTPDGQVAPAGDEGTLLSFEAVPWEDPGGARVPRDPVRGPDGAMYATVFASSPGRATTGLVVRLIEGGGTQTAYEALNFPVALGFGENGQLYVLEFARGYSTRDSRYAPNTGRLLAVGPMPTRRQVVVRDLNYPTALAFSAAGDAFFTENGAFSVQDGNGNVLRVPAQGLAMQLRQSPS